MGYLIDTNVWSELQKRERIHLGVQHWYEGVAKEDLYLSVLVVGEVRRGIERLRRRDSRQAERLEQRLEQLQAAMMGRILPVSLSIAECWGRINVPDPLPVIDGLLAATALEHDLIFVTRNVADVKRSGARLFNPFVDVIIS
ncbi:MAG: type II toxin-antitoxin system VapC family toxin [Candidatus Competibacteraceae bacterium]